jgi:hypothetical protein
MRSFRFVIVLLIISACNTGDSFYNDYEVSDLWRLPLLKPYELRNLRHATSDDEVLYSWELDFKTKNEFGGERFVKITRVNVKNGFLYGYNDKKNSNYFVINCNKNSELFFDNFSSWSQFLKENEIDSRSTLNVWDVFDEFSNNGKLAWANEVKNKNLSDK